MDCNPRCGSRSRGTHGRFAPAPDDDTRGAPDEGAPGRDQARLQGQPLLTPSASGAIGRMDAIADGRASYTREPPALAAARKHVQRRGPASPPQRPPGDGADEGDPYISFDNTAHELESAHLAEYARLRTELESLREKVGTLQAQVQAHTPAQPPAQALREGVEDVECRAL